MNNNDFFTAEEPIDQTTIKQKLHYALKQYDKLTAEPEIPLEDNKEFEKWAESIFGKFPEIKMLEYLLSMYQKKLNHLKHIEIPGLLEELGVNSLVTEDGRKVTLKPKLNVKADDPQKLYAWLEENGEGMHLKTSLSFGKGEVTEELTEFLKEKGYSYSSSYGIAWQTRDKIFKERIAENEERLKNGLDPLPMPTDDVAKIEIFNTAEVK